MESAKDLREAQEALDNAKPHEAVKLSNIAYQGIINKVIEDGEVAEHNPLNLGMRNPLSKSEPKLPKKISSIIKDSFNFLTSPSEPIKTNGRFDILSTANEYVNKDRASTYDTPEKSFDLIAEFWTVYIQNKTGHAVMLNGVDVALMMDLLKTSRLVNNPGHKDSWIDKAGYSACGGEIALDLEASKIK